MWSQYSEEVEAEAGDAVHDVSSWTLLNGNTSSIAECSPLIYYNGSSPDMAIHSNLASIIVTKLRPGSAHYGTSSVDKYWCVCLYVTSGVYCAASSHGPWSSRHSSPPLLDARLLVNSVLWLSVAVIALSNSDRGNRQFARKARNERREWRTTGWPGG